MSPKNQKNMIEALEAVRQLSFRIHKSSVELQARSDRIQRLIHEVQETMDLKTVYDSRSRELQGKLEEIKELTLGDE